MTYEPTSLKKARCSIMRVKIILHGVLRKLWPNNYECEANTPAEAMNAFMVVNDIKGPKQHIRLVGYDSIPALHSPLRSSELHLVPDFSGGNGVTKILIGAALIAAAFIPIVRESIFFGIALGMGISLALGGVLELMTPAPKTATPDKTADSESSKYLGAPKNTVSGNTRIPIGFGRYKVYGHFLSFNIQSDLTKIGTADTRRAGSGFGS